MSVSLDIYTPPAGTLRGAAQVFKFPGGEVHLNNIAEGNPDGAVYVAVVRGAGLEDLMAAALWSDVAAQRGWRFVLMLPYLPAARADRGEPDGAYTYSSFIQSMLNPFSDQVITIDPHSEIMPGYFGDTMTALPSIPLIRRAMESTGDQYDAVIAPDAGAAGRAKAAAEALGIDFYQCEKHRDFATGKLLEYKAPAIPKTGRYLVVDDICDGGRTFLALHEAINVPWPQVGLWVTHGIFSGDHAPHLGDFFNRIYTTDSHPGYNRVGCASTIIPTYTYMFDAMNKDYA